MNKTLNLFESFKINLNEQEKEELEDAKETLKNPNLTEAYIEDEFDFSIDTGVFDGDIPEIEKKYNLKIENITEPNAHHNPVYRVSGTKEDLINWIESEKLYDEDNYLKYIHESTNLNEDDDIPLKYYICHPKTHHWVYFVTKIDINKYRKSDIKRWGLLNYPGDKNKIYSVRFTKTFSKAKAFSSKEEAEEIALEPILDFEHNRSSRLSSFKKGVLQVLDSKEAESIVNAEANEENNKITELVNNAKGMVDKIKPCFDNSSNEVIPGVSNDELKQFIDILSNVTTIKQLDNLKGRFNADTFDTYIDDSIIEIENDMNNNNINQTLACKKEIKKWLINFDKFILTVQNDIKEQINESFEATIKENNESIDNVLNKIADKYKEEIINDYKSSETHDMSEELTNLLIKALEAEGVSDAEDYIADIAYIALDMTPTGEPLAIKENYNDNTINDLQAVLDRWLNSITEVKETLKNITEPDKVKEAKAWLNMATKEFDKVNEELNKLILKK